MTAADSDKIRGSWSRDGRFIYFQSDRSGSRQIWKMPSGGGEAVQMTRGEGWDSQESWDGRYLFYAQSQVSTTIWKVPVEGGEETRGAPGPREGPSRLGGVPGRKSFGERSRATRTSRSPSHPTRSGSFSPRRSVLRPRSSCSSRTSAEPAGAPSHWSQPPRAGSQAEATVISSPVSTTPGRAVALGSGSGLPCCEFRRQNRNMANLTPSTPGHEDRVR